MIDANNSIRFVSPASEAEPEPVCLLAQSTITVALNDLWWFVMRPRQDRFVKAVEAYLWVFHDHGNRLRFSDCCGVLGVSPETVREALQRKWIESQRFQRIEIAAIKARKARVA